MGRPSSGKSTLAKRVEGTLQNRGHKIENLDGDDIRKNLHPDLGFTRQDRATNNRRTAYICKLLNRNEISVVNAMITPFRKSQFRARDIIEPDGQFVLVYVKCSLDEARQRDPKGLYDQAAKDTIENFTGVNHPFQEPKNPEIVVDTEKQTISESVDHVVSRLEHLGLLEEPTSTTHGIEIDQTELQSIRERLSDLGYTNHRPGE